MQKEHAAILYLNPPMRLATYKIQAFMELGPSFAHLYIYNEGLHAMGQLSEQEYQINKLRYSKKLVEAPVQPLTREQIKEKQRLEEMQRTIQAVMTEWDNPKRNTEWREKWLRQAEKYKDQIPEAKQLIERVKARVFVP